MIFKRINRGIQKAFRKIRDLFLQTIGRLIDTFVPVRSGDIPRTSSGKIRRYKLADRFLNHDFTSIVKI
ncbi:MAG TPA: hypothetical protein VMC08_05750 [Bacteroidales bacterium]|nr:hypothetical protein [Bacteroidales bacterium]